MRQGGQPQWQLRRIARIMLLSQFYSKLVSFVGQHYLLISIHRNVAPKTQALVDARFVKCDCFTVLMIQVSGSTEKREMCMSDGKRQKGDYFTKFSCTEFRLMIVPARFIKKYFLFH